MPALWPAQPTNARIISIQAKPGDAEISHVDANEIIIQFHKRKVAGASQIEREISLK